MYRQWKYDRWIAEWREGKDIAILEDFCGGTVSYESLRGKCSNRIVSCLAAMNLFGVNDNDVKRRIENEQLIPPCIAKSCSCSKTDFFQQMDLLLRKLNAVTNK
jgi:hypothetical protein